MSKTGPLPKFAFLICYLLMIAGCKSESSVSVEGVVKLDSKPLADATVTFSPARADGPGPFVGTTDSDGHFSLHPAAKEQSGAAPGEYVVMITTVKPDPNDPEGHNPKQKEIVPPAFTDGSKRFTIPAGGTKVANYDIKTR
jgi:hypothetical protein